MAKYTKLTADAGTYSISIIRKDKGSEVIKEETPVVTFTSDLEFYDIVEKFGGKIVIKEKLAFLSISSEENILSIVDTITIKEEKTEYFSIDFHSPAKERDKIEELIEQIVETGEANFVVDMDHDFDAMRVRVATNEEGMYIVCDRTEIMSEYARFQDTANAVDPEKETIYYLSDLKEYATIDDDYGHIAEQIVDEVRSN